MRVCFCSAMILLLSLLCTACNSGGSATRQPQPAPGVTATESAAPAPPLAGLPAPTELRSLSWDPGDRLIYGFLFADPMPHAGVTAGDPPWAEFTSQYQLQPAPDFDDVAFALYRFYVMPDTEPLLCTSWESPPGPLGCYIGLANYQKNSWDWFACSGDDISLPPLSPYIVDDLLTVAVCVLEEGPLNLQWIRLGPSLPPEVRLSVENGHTHVDQPVGFMLTGSEDPELDIALYELDFDGDGTWDYSSQDTPDTSHSYGTPGTYTASGRVTDGDGLSAIAERMVYISGFAPQQVDETGYSPSIAIDPVTDTPKISYSGGENNTEVRVATLTDPVDISTLYTMPDQNMETALLLTPTNMEIAFGSGQLFYAIHGAVNDGTLVDADKAAGKPAIATDGEGETSILYSHLEGEFPVQTAHLTRAYGDYTNFDFEQLDASDPTGRYCDAAYEGYLSCAYAADEGQSNGRLVVGFFSTIDGWTWNTARENMHRYSSRVSLAIDPGDHQPRIAYIGDPDGGGAYHEATYAWYAEDDWLVEPLEQFAWDCHLALDADGHPHVVASVHVANPDRARFWHHWHDGSEWHREFVADSAAGDVDYLETAVDAAGKTHLCWTFIPESGDVSELWYATVAD